MPNEFTTNYGLNKPDFNLVTWHDLVNGNFDLLDSVLFALSGLSGFVGVWTNATNYTIGQRVMDADDASIWQVAVVHTSAATGTMGDDRAANPSFWTPITELPFITGEWQNDKLYNVGDVAYHTADGLFGIANTQHTSLAAPDTMRDDILKWNILFDSSFIANAANIGFTPAGTIAAINVQSALEELDSDNQAGHATLQNSINGKVSTGDTNYLLPPGLIASFAGATAPTGWLLCFGQAVSRTTFAPLFAEIGTTYGPGDGSTTFNLPDLRDRVAIGQGDMGGVAANRISIAIAGFNPNTLGAAGGTDRSILAQANLPNVNFVSSALTAITNVVLGFAGSLATIISGGSNTTAAAGADRNVRQNVSADTLSIQSATTTIGGHVPSGGSGTAFSNIPPSLVLNYIIKT